MGSALLAAGCTVTAVSLLGDDLAPAATGERSADEKACMLARAGKPPSPGMVVIAPISEPGGCGIEAPLQVSAFADGIIAVAPTATLGCPLVTAVDQWMTTSVQPAAKAHFGSHVVGIRQLSNYACRRPRGYRPGHLSEHSYGNALDVAEFRLANGRVVSVLNGWGGTADEQAFLREISVTACQQFRTFLGPGVAFHGNHFHVDLAYRGESGRDRYCRPLPKVAIPAGRQPPEGIWVASDPKRRGRLLSDMPPDVAAGLEDPFGVAGARR